MNWIALSVDDLRAVAAGEIVDGASSPAVAAAIAEAVAVVRGTVAAGSALDADPATVPGSLRSLAARTAVFGLLETVGVGLSGEQRVTRAADVLRLAEIRDQRQRIEPAGNGGGSQTVVPGNEGNGRAELRGI